MRLQHLQFFVSDDLWWMYFKASPTNPGQFKELKTRRSPVQVELKLSGTQPSK